MRATKDIHDLLSLDEEPLPDDRDVVQLWDGGNRQVAGGVSYAEPIGADEW